MLLLLVAAALVAHGPVVDAFCVSPAYSKVRRVTALQFKVLILFVEFRFPVGINPPLACYYGG